MPGLRHGLVISALAILPTGFGLRAYGQGFGNIFEKAPPHIEQALRERVSFFYQSHVDGKFRMADQAVHEDSKDIFFGADKTKFGGFKIVGITYDDDYKKAKVVVDADDYFVFLGVGKMKINRAISSTWKFDNGQWWWYVEPVGECKESPFGCMKQTSGGEAPVDLSQKLGTDTKQLVQRLYNSVKVSKSQIDLQSITASSDEITLTNQFEAAVTLKLDAPEDVLGLSVKLDATKIEPGQSAKLTVTHKPQNKSWKPDIAARISVDPTGQVIPIRIVFAYPPKEASSAPNPVKP